jgi:hypothetical protein
MKTSPFEPELMEVVVTGGRPFSVKLKKKLQKVEKVDNLWRIDDGWWRKPVARLYYSLTLESGSRITLFQDLLSGQWYRQNWTG